MSVFKQKVGNSWVVTKLLWLYFIFQIILHESTQGEAFSLTMCGCLLTWGLLLQQTTPDKTHAIPLVSFCYRRKSVKISEPRNPGLSRSHHSGAKFLPTCTIHNPQLQFSISIFPIHTVYFYTYLFCYSCFYLYYFSIFSIQSW